MAMSFAIQRPHSRSKAFHDSDEEDEAQSVKDEKISDFDLTRRKPALASAADRLIIPSQPNKDWKAEAARLRSKKTQTYLPTPKVVNSAISTEDSDRIVDKTLGGLKVTEKLSRRGTVTPATELAQSIDAATLDSPLPTPVPMTEDERALKELLRGPAETEEDAIETIRVAEDSFNLHNGGSHNEDDLFKSDLASRPDSSTLDDYARVPVEQFGAALLRGMSGLSSSRPVKTEAYIPKARPSLLGIGAKALEMPTDGTASKKEVSAREAAIKRREAMHFVPLVKRKVVAAIEGTSTNSLLMPPPVSTASTPTRRRRSPSPSSDSYSKRHRRERSYSPERRRRRDDSDDERDRRRRDRSRSPREKRRDDGDRKRSRRDDKDRERERDRDRDRSGKRY